MACDMAIGFGVDGDGGVGVWGMREVVKGFFSKGGERGGLMGLMDFGWGKWWGGRKCSRGGVRGGGCWRRRWRGGNIKYDGAEIEGGEGRGQKKMWTRGRGEVRLFYNRLGIKDIEKDFSEVGGWRFELLYLNSPSLTLCTSPHLLSPLKIKEINKPPWRLEGTKKRKTHGKWFLLIHDPPFLSIDWLIWLRLWDFNQKRRREEGREKYEMGMKGDEGGKRHVYDIYIPLFSLSRSNHNQTTSEKIFPFLLMSNLSFFSWWVSLIFVSTVTQQSLNWIQSQRRMERKSLGCYCHHQWNYYMKNS